MQPNRWRRRGAIVGDELMASAKISALSNQTGLSFGDCLVKLIRFWLWFDKQDKDIDVIRGNGAAQLAHHIPGTTEDFWSRCASLGIFSISNEGVRSGWIGRYLDGTEQRIAQKRERNRLDQRRHRDRVAERAQHANPVQYLDSSFEKFWEAYPRKKDIGSARRAWNDLKPSEQLCGQDHGRP